MDTDEFDEAIIQKEPDKSNAEQLDDTCGESLLDNTILPKVKDRVVYIRVGKNKWERRTIHSTAGKQTEKYKDWLNIIDEKGNRKNRLEVNKIVEKGKLNGITEQVERQEQHSRQNCLLIHGITEGNQENTDDLALEIFREKLYIELTQRDLDRTHRIDKNDKSNNRPRPIIVNFIRYNDRKKNFSKKKQLKNSEIPITKSLTKA